jgi:hypothetical protein
MIALAFSLFSAVMVREPKPVEQAARLVPTVIDGEAWILVWVRGIAIKAEWELISNSVMSFTTLGVEQKMSTLGQRLEVSPVESGQSGRSIDPAWKLINSLEQSEYKFITSCCC